MAVYFTVLKPGDTIVVDATPDGLIIDRKAAKETVKAR